MWADCRGAFKTEKSWRRARNLLVSSLVCLGRHTITGFLCAAGRQFRDWSGDYRVFSESRFEPDELFSVITRRLADCLQPGEPFVAAMDDSILRKTGRRIPGVKYHRDPMSPPFRVNLVRGQRVIQLSGALPAADGQGPARMIPVDFVDLPSPAKPRKNAPAQAWQRYRESRLACSAGRVGALRLHALRSRLDADASGQGRPLWVVVDGGFTNKTVLKDLPERSVLVGRIRGDAKLYHPPCPESARPLGRRRVYGRRAATPEQLRQDESVPWQTICVSAAGAVHHLKVKTLAPLRWRSAGQHHTLRLVVIAPLAYRPRKGSRLLYRRPAYLISTDPDIPVEKVVQAYIWRWDIEVNFRDEKQVLGVGEAQVRSADSVRTAPALVVAAYAMLLLAAARALGASGSELLPEPKWRTGRRKARASTADLIRHLRCELWGQALGVSHFSGFTTPDSPDAKPENHLPHLQSAVLYAVG